MRPIDDLLFKFLQFTGDVGIVAICSFFLFGVGCGVFEIIRWFFKK